MLIVTGVFIILFAAWMLLGWLVAESRNINWLKRWCATIFVVTSILTCFGGGVWVTQKRSESAARSSVRELTRQLHERLQEGRVDDVRDALQHIAEEPDESSPHSRDILRRIADVTTALQKTSRSQIARKDGNAN